MSTLKDFIKANDEWNKLSYEEKNRQLFFKQKKMLEILLEKNAITKEQFNKSLGDLTVKMGIKE